jgi:integrase
VHLTDIAIRALPHPAIGQRDYTDDLLPGLTIRVGTRTKTFMIVVAKGKQRSRITIGRYPTTTLSDARSKARTLIGEAQERKSGPPKMTFNEAFTLFKQTHTSQKNRERTAKETERLITKHLVPALSGTDLGDIETPDVAQIIDRLLATPSTALHVYAAARLIFRWAAHRRLIDRSPVEFLPAPTKITFRDRVLTDDELTTVYRAAQDGSTFAKIIQLLVLTGQRKSQIATLRAEYIDANARTTTWPPGTMKGDRQHTIPLGPMAEAILETLPKEGYLLRARGKETPFCGFSKAKPDFDKRLESVGPWVIHDLRRTFASGLQALGTRIEVTEKLLAHTSGTMAGIVGIYQRHSYMDEMREAVGKWEAKLRALLRDPVTPAH